MIGLSPTYLVRVPVIDCSQKLYDQIRAMPTTKTTSLHGYEIRLSKALPETVMDKDGNEVELLGIMGSENECVMLTGSIVRRKEDACATVSPPS